MALMRDYGGDFELPPEGRHVACLVRFVDLGLQPGKFGSSRNAELAFEIDGETTADGRPMLAFKRIFNLSNRSKNFREIVRALSQHARHLPASIPRTLSENGAKSSSNMSPPRTGPNMRMSSAARSRARRPRANRCRNSCSSSLHPDEFREEDLKEVSDRQREKIKSSETYKTLIDDRKFGAAAKGKRRRHHR